MSSTIVLTKSNIIVNFNGITKQISRLILLILKPSRVSYASTPLSI